MNNQNVNKTLPKDLTQAIDSIAAMNAPADSVQRVIDQSIAMSATKSMDSTKVLTSIKSPIGISYQYLMLACCLVAFLSPLVFKLLKDRLDMLPGWDNPTVRVLVVALVTFSFAALAWSFGQSILGTIEKRTAARVRGIANVGALVVFGLVFSSLMAGPSNLYAQMQKTMARVKTIQYVMTFTDGKSRKELSRTKTFMQDQNLRRFETGVEDLNFMTMIMDFSQKKYLMLDSQEKIAKFMPLYQTEGMVENWNKADKYFRGIDLDGKLIGDSTVNGRLCSDFEVLDDGETATISIDKKTKLPVQMKMVAGEDLKVVAVLNQFVFDQPLDPKLFSLTAPAGYTSTEVEWKEPVDDSALKLVPGEHFGPAKFGMTMEQVIEALGQPDTISESADAMLMEAEEPEKNENALEWLQSFSDSVSARELNYESRGFSLLVVEKKGLIGINCFGVGMGGRVFQGGVAGGIKMGDSPEDVRKVFGGPTRKPNLNWGESKSNLNYMTNNGSTIRFTFHYSKLVSVINRKKD